MCCSCTPPHQNRMLCGLTTMQDAHAAVLMNCRPSAALEGARSYYICSCQIYGLQLHRYTYMSEICGRRRADFSRLPGQLREKKTLTVACLALTRCTNLATRKKNTCFVHCPRKMRCSNGPTFGGRFDMFEMAPFFGDVFAITQMASFLGPF